MNIFNFIKCCIFGHQYFVLRSLSASSDLLGCKRCKKLFGMNNDVIVMLPWDRELEKFYMNQKKLLEELKNG